MSSSNDPNQATTPDSSLYAYNPDISNLALQSINLVKFNELSRISEEGDIKSNQPKHQSVSRTSSLKYDGPRPSTQSVISGGVGGAADAEAKLIPLDSASCISEQVL